MIDKQLLKNYEPLSGLSDAHLDDLARKASVETVKAGKFLFKQGKRDQSSYFLVSGEMTLLNGKTIESLVMPGTDAARHELVRGQPRKLSARAKTACEVLQIDSSLLDVLLSWDQSATSHYEVTEIESEDDEDWMTKMLQSDLFQRLPASNIQQLIMRMEEVELNAGDIVVSQNDEGDFYYIIKQGVCEVIRKPSKDARLIKIAELRTGDSFGEESLLSGGKRNATIRMMTAGKLMRLSKENFDSLLRDPVIAQISYEDLKSKVDNGGRVIDVRLPGEYQNSRIEHSVNLPVAGIRDAASELEMGVEYVMVCDTGTRSASAAFLLKKLGFNTFLLRGGLASVPQEDLVGMAVGAQDIAVGQTATAPAETAKDASADVIDFKPPAKDEAAEKQRKEAEAMQKQMQAQLEAMRKELAEGQQKLGQQQAKLTELNAEENKRREQLQELNTSLDAASDHQQEIDKLKDELSAASAKLASQAQQITASKAVSEEAREKEEQLKQLQDKLRKADETIEKQNQENQARDQDVSRLKRELEKHQVANREQQEALTSELDNLQAEINNRDSKMLELRKQMEDKQQSLSSIEQEKTAEINEFEHQIAELQEQLSQQSDSSDQVSKDMQAKLDSLNAEREAAVNNLQSELGQAQSELDAFNEQLKSSIDERQKAEQALTDANGELNALREASEKQQQAFEKEKASLQAELEASRSIIQQERDALEAELAAARQQLEEKDEQMQQSEQEQLRARQELEDKLKAEQERAREQAEQRESLQASLTDAKAALEAKEREQAEANEQLHDKLAQAQAALDEKEREEEEQRAQLQAELERAQQELASRDEQSEKTQEELELKLQQAQAALDSKEKEQEAGRAILQQQLEQAQTELDAKLNEQEESNKELQQKLQAAQQELDDKEHEIQQRNEEEEQLRIELNKTKISLEEKAKALDHFAEQHAQTLAAQDKLEKTLEQSKSALQQAQDDLQAKEKALADAGNIGEEAVKRSQEEIDQLNKDVDTLRRRWEQAVNEKEKAEGKYEQQAQALKEKEDQLQAAVDTDHESEEVKRLQQELEEMKEQMSRDDMTYQTHLENLRNELLTNNQSQLQAEIDKARKTAEEEIMQLRAELAEAHESNESVNQILKERETELHGSQDKLKSLEMELSIAHEQGQDTEGLRQQLQILKKSMKTEFKKQKNKVEAAMYKVKKENTDLRRELEGFYRNAEVHSEMGGVPSEMTDSVIEPLDLGETAEKIGSEIDLGAPVKIPEEKPQPVPAAKQPQRQAPASTDSEFINSTGPDSVYNSTFDNSDIFSLSDIDANLFSKPVETKKSGKGKLVAALLVVAAAGGGGAWWFLGQKPSPAPAPTAQTPTQPAVEKPVAKAPVAKQPSTKPAVKAPVAKKPVAKKPVTTVTKKPAAPAGAMKPGRVYRDFLKAGGFGPVMVTVPSGNFMMGSARSSTYFDERPARKVTLKGFSISRFEVTFDEYDKFARATGRSRPADNGWGRGRRPVINVSWNDARAYAKWLSSQTGRRYRLPTEAEWEYAARAGTTERYIWGRYTAKNKANCFNCGTQWDRKSTAPVGSFAANPLGLHDMAGNVLEWVQDCYVNSYKGAPVNGTAVSGGACDTRVVRGGAYRTTLKNLRVTKRDKYDPAVRIDNVGFRLVRE